MARQQTPALRRVPSIGSPWVTPSVDLLGTQTSDDVFITGGYINGAAFDDRVLRPERYGAVGDGVTNDTAAVQRMWNDLEPGQCVVFTRKYLLDPIDAPVNRTWVLAFGATFTLNSDGVLFNFNPDADPANVEATSKSYGYWYGGAFYANGGAEATNRVAMRAYGIRQMTIRDCVFGDTTTIGQFSSAIQIAFLGAHNIVKNRFLWCGIAIDCPNAGAGETGLSIPITTSTFQDNEFILHADLTDATGASDISQKAFFVDGGWDRWRITGGFCNGSGGTVGTPNKIFHFTNRFGCTNLLVQGLGCEQSRPNSSFFYFQSISSNAIQNIAFRDLNIDGDPAGGGHIAIEMERTSRVTLANVRTTAMTGTNKSLKMDANCSYLEVDNACRMVDPALNPSASVDINASVDREEIIFPSRYLTDPLPLAGYNGDAFSTGTHTLDMSTLITGNRYPKHGIHPRGYTLLVQARDSGGIPSRQVQLGRTVAELSQARNTLFLPQDNLDERFAMTVYQPAHTDGTIFVEILASGVGTLDLWIFVLAIHM